jgi:DNA-binding transcriptional regulator YiaG
VTAAELLVIAYEKGAAKDGSIEWEDLDEAYAKAIEELPPSRVAEIRSAQGLTPTGELPDEEEE